MTKLEKIVCPKCGRSNKIGKQDCIKCGYFFVYAHCGKCKKKNLKTNIFCYNCGLRIGSKLKTIITNFKKRPKVVIGLAVFVIVLTFVALGYASRFVNVYPIVRIGQKSTTLKCNYSGKDLSIGLKLYANIDNYYHNNSLKNGLRAKGDFQRMVYASTYDSTIKDLASNIKEIANKNGLNQDQTLELALCFVQNIPYDDAKASYVLSGKTLNDQNLAQYPYETLYKNSGICTDKTYLGSALFKELGYGTGILIFPEDKHMALGVLVPPGYANFNSKYAMVEVTSPGFIPGELPTQINDNDGKPSRSVSNLSELNKDDDPSSLRIESRSIEVPTLIIDINEGLSFQRIIAVKDLERKIISSLSTLKNKLDALQSAKIELNKRYYMQNSAYSYYLSLPSTNYECGYKYSYSYFSGTYGYNYKCDYVTNTYKNSAYSTYVSYLSSYNNQVNLYNLLISSYNNYLNSIKLDLSRYQNYYSYH